MKPYLALIQNDIRLAFRQKVVIFFNYLMPLVLFFIFAESMHAEQGGAILRVVTMVVVIGILGNGLFGAGMRAVQDRETNVLRRYKVAPISPLPLLVSATVTGLVVYLPFVAFILLVAKSRYGMQLPPHVAATAIFITLGVVAVRAIGLILSSVVNTMAEAQILVQILYLAMLMLSGATFPITSLPGWLVTVTQFIPSTYLVTGLQGIMLRNESLLDNWQATGALLLTTVVGLLMAVKLFRWEKEEKMRPAAKLWLVAVLMPFLLLGTWQMKAKDNVVKAKIIDRDLQRSRNLLVRNARIFIGDGRVIENGAVLVKGGKIAAVYDGNIPDPKSVSAEPIEAAGKTILPGLIDTHVHLGAPGGVYDDWKGFDVEKAMQQELAAYLYSGVTAVRSAGDWLDSALAVRTRVNSGEKQGAELFVLGTLSRDSGASGAEILDYLPEAVRPRQQAKVSVADLRKSGVDGFTAVQDGSPLEAIGTEAHADGLPFVVDTGDARGVENALRAGANAIEEGSFREKIPDGVFATMAKTNVTYDPALSVAEALQQVAAGKAALLSRSLVQQVGPPELLAATRKAIGTRKPMGQPPVDMEVALNNLRRALNAGVTLITGTDAGSMLVVHGPTVQHEIELWAAAGIPVEVALRAATLNAAQALRADSRLGSIQVGRDATMLVVDGNPLQDVRAIEAISFVIFKGERVDRAGLLKPE